MWQNMANNGTRPPVSCAISATILLLCSILCSCSRKIYVPAETTVYHTDTLRLTQLRIDSVFMRDSVSLIQRGDTVFLTKYRDRFRYRDRIDTVYKATVDTARISVPYPVERKLTKWERTKQDVGGMAIGGMVIAVCIAAIWLIRKFKKK